MNTMEPSRGEKEETLKDVIEDISGINKEMNSQLRMIADALAQGSCSTDNDKVSDDPRTIMDAIRRDRDEAKENLKLLIHIRGYLW